jgi:hypothetical protein
VPGYDPAPLQAWKNDVELWSISHDVANVIGRSVTYSPVVVYPYERVSAPGKP